jgi:hypothetical protein
MIITKTFLPRRTFLRGVGATLALPLLDGMFPAFTSIAKAAAKPAMRLGVWYLPNGVIIPSWTPKAIGSGYEFSPILKPLEPLRDHVLVLSGLNSEPAKALPDEGQGDHSRGPGSFLTGAHVKKSEGADIRAGVSLDQIAARELGKETQLASLEIGLDSSEFPGACDIGYSCAYSGTVSWRDARTPLPMENDPRRVFERLFGASDSTDPRERQTQNEKERSLLDSVLPDVDRLANRLGPSDRVKLSQYLDSVRDIEQRISMAEAQNSKELPLMAQPDGTPSTFTDHVGIMSDLLLLAFQTDMTRIFTFMLGREQTGRVYPEIGIPDGHHGLSHHAGDPVKIAKVAKINTHQVELLAKFAEKLRTTPDGDGSLLDHSMIIYGGGISDGNLHNHNDLPIVLVGGGGAQIHGGRHLQFAPTTPLMNLGATLLDKMGIPFEHLGDATGRLAELSAIS